MNFSVKNTTNANNKSLSKKAVNGTLAAVMMMSAPVGIMAGALVTQPAVAKTSQAADNVTAAKRLNKLLSNAKSMTANFTQKTTGSASGGGSLSAGGATLQGTMSVKRPNNFRWETKSPSQQLVVANGNTMWIYDKDLEQVTKQSVANQIGNTPALLLSGDYQKIAQNFKITQPNASVHYYKLFPKSSSANFKSMSISFEGGKPARMILSDNLGQVTSIKFTNAKLNPSISASKFTFTPPKGVDVISQ